MTVLGNLKEFRAERAENGVVRERCRHPLGKGIGVLRRC